MEFLFTKWKFNENKLHLHKKIKNMENRYQKPQTIQKQSNITMSKDLHSALGVRCLNSALLYQLYLGDLSFELILFQPAIAQSDSADDLLPATYVPPPYNRSFPTI